MSSGARDLRYDVVKGLAIILMVVGHAGCWSPLLKFIYLFHMPVFFIVAGWFYRTPSDWRGAVRYGWRRILRIWWPCVFWASVVVLLHNVFIRLNFYSSPGDGLAAAYARWGLSVPWGAGETLHHLGQAFLMRDGMVGMGAPYWFLPIMFYAAVVYMALDFALSKIRRLPRLILITLGLLLFVCLARYTDVKFMKSIAKRIGGRNSITALYLFNIGVVLRYFDWRIDRLPICWRAAVAVASVGILIALMPLGTLGLSDNLFPSVWFLTVSSLCGWWILCALGGIPGTLQRVLAKIGAHTMPILLLHLYAFKAVSAVGVVAQGLPWNALGRPVVSFSGFGWCVAYIGAGVALPIVANDICWRCYRLMAARLQRSHEV